MSDAFDDIERWGEPPTAEAPTGTSWCGDWQRALEWHTDLPDDHPGYPIWSREALEHDDHEDCCHHTRFVTVLAGLLDEMKPQ